MFPFRTTILQGRAQLQELNSRLESYLARVRELEEENGLLSAEIQRLRQSPGTERSVDEIKKMRWSLEDAAKEKARSEIQRRHLQQEIEELSQDYRAEQTLHHRIRQELGTCQQTLQQIEDTNSSLEGVILHLQGECQSLRAQHELDVWELGEEVRRGRQVLGTRTSLAGPSDRQLLASLVCQENLVGYRYKIQALASALEQDKGRREELNGENELLRGEIEILKKDLEDQFILQSQLEDDFLTFQLQHEENVEEFKRDISAMEEEKRHLTSAIALHLIEQQKLMHVKMGLNLELVTYRALLKAEQRKEQDLKEHLWKPRKSIRSHQMNVMPIRKLDVLQEKPGKPNKNTVPSSFWRDVVTINKAIPSQTSFLGDNLLYTEKSSSAQNVARSRNTDSVAAGSTPTPRESFSSGESQDQHKVPPEEDKSEMALPGPEHAGEAAIQDTSRTHTVETVKDEKSAKPQNSGALSKPVCEMEHYDLIGRPREPEEEEYTTQHTKHVITLDPGVKELEFRADLSEVGSFIQPNSHIPADSDEVNIELMPCYSISDTITENEEPPRTESVEEIQTKGSAEDSSANRIILSKEGIQRDKVRIGDVIETIIEPTDLGKMVSPETGIRHHIEEEVLEDGTTRREIVIQSRVVETVDLADECTLGEVLAEDSKGPEVQLKGVLEHLPGSEAGFIDGLLNLDRKGHVSVNIEQTSEAQDFPSPSEVAPLWAGAKESEPEGANGKHEEVLNLTMSAADFRRTILLGSEPELQTFLESPVSFPLDRKTEVEKDRAELYGINEQCGRMEKLHGDEGAENIEQAKFTLHDPLSRELCSPRIIEQSIKVPQGVQESIIELLKEETEDPKLKLKGALEHLKGAVPEDLRDELSMLTGGNHEIPDNLSVNIKNIQQSSQSGIVTLEAEVNVLQTFDPDDIFSPKKYNEDHWDVVDAGSGLTFLNNQQELQGLLNGKHFPMVESEKDEGRIKAKAQVLKEKHMLFEPSARGVEVDEIHSPTQGHTGHWNVHETIVSSEMEGKASHWLQKGIGKMYGEEFIHKVSDPAYSSVPLHVSMRSSGGGSEGSMPLVTHEETAEGVDGKRDKVYYEEWKSESREELDATDANEE
ncbi:synemin [Narcine bancroftii]|uniref:synemin n=1 Tax=Narcine bancroftii TaxID=1343680 RepID=UPI00383129E3